MLYQEIKIGLPQKVQDLNTKEKQHKYTKKKKIHNYCNLSTVSSHFTQEIFDDSFITEVLKPSHVILNIFCILKCVIPIVYINK